MLAITVVKLLGQHDQIPSFKKPLLVVPTRLSSFNFLPVVLLKCPYGHLIQSEQCLIWILYQDVFAIFHVSAHIDDGPDDTPAVGEVEIHLLGEFARIVADDAEDDVSVRDFRRSSGYKTVIKD